MKLKALRLTYAPKALEQSVYKLSDGVQARREKFGLLIYNYRGPRLYFLPSKSLIDAGFFEGKQTVGQLVDTILEKHKLPRRKVLDHIAQILQMLQAKGLIDGKPIC